MMMKSDLPLDLVEEILARVPATSLTRLRSTCRRWNALFKDQRFTDKHFSKAPKESMVLMLKKCRVCPMIVNLNVTPPSLEFKGAFGLKDSHSNSEQVDIVQVFHCDGLLLCKTKDNRLVVWNPCLGETRWIQLKVDYKKHGSRFTLGYIQNNKSPRSDKILRRWVWGWGGCNEQLFDIYEFSSDSCRVLGHIENCFIHCNGYSGGASSLKGNTYWVAIDKKREYEFILCFDFTTERFKHLCLPPFQNHGHHVTLSVRLWGNIIGIKCFEIYEFSSDSWRVIDDVDHNCCIIGHGVSLKGNTYWLAYDHKENSKFLLSFYFRAERFKCLCLPHFQDVSNMVLSVVREEQLSVLNLSHSTSNLEVWITNNIDTEATLLWSKSFAVNLDTCRNYFRVSRVY